MLAALADLDKPTSFEDLKIVLQAGDSTIRDAIGGVREMFLSVDDAGTETLFSLAPLTRSFVISKRSSLTLYPTFKQRVINFRKSIKITSPEVTKIVATIRRIVPLRFRFHSDQAARAALVVVRDSRLTERVTEDSIFRATKGYVEAIQERPDMAIVRQDFLYSIQVRHEPEIEELLAWFNAEKKTQTIEENLYLIMDTVISGRRYSEEEKIGMISRKATTAYNIARQNIYLDAEAGLKGFRESVMLHLRAFKLNALSASPMTDISEKYAKSTADQWLSLLSKGNKWNVIVALKQLESDCDGYLDPVAEPFNNQLRRIGRSALFSAERSRIHNESKKLLAAGFDKRKWMDTTLSPAISKELSALVERTKSR